MKNLLFLFSLFFSITALAQKKSTVQYKHDEKIKKKYNSVDIYPAKGQNNPVVIFVHGGAWLLGDKDTKIKDKVKLFHDLNYTFVSVNYRLSSFFNKKTQYPDHPNDVADAIKWITQNIQNYGGNPQNMILLGHSAGAQMVSLLGTNREFFEKRGIEMGDIKGIISVDTEGYDVAALGQENVKIYKRIFGEDPKQWTDASPIHQIAENKIYPPFLIFYRGKEFRREMAENFAAKLRRSQTQAELYSAEPYSHFESNNKIGTPGDTIVTPKITDFMQRNFRKP